MDHDPIAYEAVFASRLAEVQGGAVAFEHTGAAVTRSQIRAHERFGCATGGVLVFDAEE
jgi:hypothetical protein